MKIAINGLSISSGGGVTYLVNLLPALGHLDPENQYYLLSSYANAGLVQDLPENFHQVRVRIPRESNILRGLYEQFLLPRYLARNNFDLLYSPADITSLRARCAVVLAMRNPNLYTTIPSSWGLPNRARLGIMKLLARFSAAKADGIIFVSRESLEEISARLRIPRGKCVAIHHGINPEAFSRGNVKALPRQLPRRFLLSISTIYHYKNFLALMEAYRLLRDQRQNSLPPLIIVGGNADAPYYQKMLTFIKDNQLGKMIFLAGKYSYQMIPSLYAGARAFIFPSYLETFGHPSLEAMVTGVPVAAADIPVMREILGEAALYFDPHRPEEITRSIARILDDDRLSASLREKGKKRGGEFTWEKTAAQTLRLFQEIGNNRNGCFRSAELFEDPEQSEGTPAKKRFT